MINVVDKTIFIPHTTRICLSCTLFLLSINELLNIIKNPALKTCYVDDCNICISGKNLISPQQHAQIILNQVEEFSDDTVFRISLQKTYYMIFSRRHKNIEDIQLQMNGHKIEEKKQGKILGVIMDYKLSWVPHIRMLKQQCTKRLNIIKVLSSNSWGADFHIIKKTYEAIVRSKLDYASIFFDAASKSIKSTLDPINNTGARLICGAFRTSPAYSLLCEAGIPKLSERRRNLSINYVLKAITNPNNPVKKLFQIAKESCQENITKGNYPNSLSYRVLFNLKNSKILFQNYLQMTLLLTLHGILRSRYKLILLIQL